jgi:hypothetical protein
VGEDHGALSAVVGAGRVDLEAAASVYGRRAGFVHATDQDSQVVDRGDPRRRRHHDAMPSNYETKIYNASRPLILPAIRRGRDAEDLQFATALHGGTKPLGLPRARTRRGPPSEPPPTFSSTIPPHGPGRDRRLAGLHQSSRAEPQHPIRPSAGFQTERASPLHRLGWLLRTTSRRLA